MCVDVMDGRTRALWTIGQLSSPSGSLLPFYTDGDEKKDKKHCDNAEDDG